MTTVRVTKYFVLLALMGVSGSFVSAGESLHEYCSRVFEETQQCPESFCQPDCLLGIRYENCPLSCFPKLCFEISSQECPLDFCQRVRGCSGEEVCYQKDSPLQGDLCGKQGYGGPSACCDGLMKVCGVKIFDGSCDRSAEKSAFSVPICLPCGDGVCGHMENSCNCPKDCD